MTKCLVGALAVTAILLVVILVKYWYLKAEMRNFANKVNKLCEPGRSQPVTVGSFAASSVELANAINRFAEKKQRELEQYRQDSDRLSKIIAGISHDFRTPLTSAEGYLQMVLREGASELSEREREYLVIVNRKIRYLRELSDDFFELTELGKEIDNAEKGDNRKDRIKLTALVTDTILGQNAWIEERGLQVTFDLPDKEIIIESNEHALRRILENLFSNAKKYANSELAVSLKVQNEGVWAITLQNDYADAGKIDIAKLFDPFYRSEARSGQGSGLGLYVVKNLAGWLGYEVQAGIEGAYFFITISDNNGTEE